MGHNFIYKHQKKNNIGLGNVRPLTNKVFRHVHADYMLTAKKLKVF
jgi:hypothetical protein